MGEENQKMLLRRSEVMRLLGIGRKAFCQATGPGGILQAVYLARDKRGRPKGAAFYRRVDVLKLNN